MAKVGMMKRAVVKGCATVSAAADAAPSRGGGGGCGATVVVDELCAEYDRVVALCLLPALSLLDFPATPLCIELWEVLRHRPYEVRYGTYYLESTLSQ